MAAPCAQSAAGTTADTTTTEMRWRKNGLQRVVWRPIVSRRTSLGEHHVEPIAGPTGEAGNIGAQLVAHARLVDAEIVKGGNAARDSLDQGPRQPRILEQAAVMRECDLDRSGEAADGVALIIEHDDLHGRLDRRSGDHRAAGLHAEADVRRR